MCKAGDGALMSTDFSGDTESVYTCQSAGFTLWKRKMIMLVFLFKKIEGFELVFHCYIENVSN